MKFNSTSLQFTNCVRPSSAVLKLGNTKVSFRVVKWKVTDMKVSSYWKLFKAFCLSLKFRFIVKVICMVLVVFYIHKSVCDVCCDCRIKSCRLFFCKCEALFVFIQPDCWQEHWCFILLFWFILCETFYNLMNHLTELFCCVILSFIDLLSLYVAVTQTEVRSRYDRPIPLTQCQGR